MNIRKIYEYIDAFAPFADQDKYDNSGFLVGDIEDEVRGICFALDATLEVIAEARENGANLLITHHPLIFHPLTKLEPGSGVFELVQSGIALISAHTNLDIHGLTDIMLERLGFPLVGECLHPVNPDGSGYGRVVELAEALSPRELAQRCKEAFGCTCVRFSDGKKPVKRVAVCSGACGDEMENAVAMGCQALIGGDFKWDRFVTAEKLGFSLIDAGHFHTESIMADWLCERLSRDFPDIPMFTAKNSRDLCEYV